MRVDPFSKIMRGSPLIHNRSRPTKISSKLMKTPATMMKKSSSTRVKNLQGSARQRTSDKTTLVKRFSYRCLLQERVKKLGIKKSRLANAAIKDPWARSCHLSLNRGFAPSACSRSRATLASRSALMRASQIEMNSLLHKTWIDSKILWISKVRMRSYSRVAS